MQTGLLRTDQPAFAGGHPISFDQKPPLGYNPRAHPMESPITLEQAHTLSGLLRMDRRTPPDSHRQS